LFNGFSEGNPHLLVDVYAETAIIYNYAKPAENAAGAVDETLTLIQKLLPWIKTVMLKIRDSEITEERNGRVISGIVSSSMAIVENNIRYAINLWMNRDASFYLDTRNLRTWAMENMRGKTVLNTFAYTGSLGVAAMAGGAARVVQLDRNKKFLELAKKSCEMNGFSFSDKDFLAGDFWRQISHFKKKNERFDCVFLDPPFFAVNRECVVDMVNNSARMINKVRPLINDGGYLVVINNALYVSGVEYMRTLEGLASDGYLKITEIIPVPKDLVGYSNEYSAKQITDPAPFNHSTKIAVLEVRRKTV